MPRFCLVTVFLCSMLFTSAYGQQREMELNGKNENEIDLKYLFFLPEGYDDDQKSKWPLILFLHGIGERGNDLELVKIHGIPKIVETEKKFPFIALSPQCPADYVWKDEAMQEAVLDLLLKILKNYRVDNNRVYVTGLSVGGYGTWALAAKNPDLFAAAVPICGGGEPSTARVLKDMPIWVFHGARDEVVLPEESEKMVRALQRVNGKVRYTLYPHAYHDSWTETYANPELYDWLLTHKRADH